MVTRPDGLEATVNSLQKLVAELTANAAHEREVAAGLGQRIEKLERCLAAKPWASGPPSRGPESELVEQDRNNTGQVRVAVIGEVDAQEAKGQEPVKAPWIPGQVQAEQGDVEVNNDELQKESQVSNQVSSAPPAVEPQACSTEETTVWDKAPLATEPELEHAIHESVWETCTIVGLPGVGKVGSVLLVVSLLLNVTLQVYLCYALLANPSFSKFDHFKDMVPHLKRWRKSVAHSDNQLDASGSSLASRVCGNDQALSVAGSQLSLLDSINTYLGMGPDQLENSSFSPGQFLCMVCLFIFVVLVLRELRSTAVSLAAFLELPRGRETVLQGDRFDVISRGRLAGAVAVGVLRASISTALLFAGITWIASTHSTTDLILNAAALGFILELDEVLFATMVPMRAQKFVRRLEPLHVQRPPASSEALVPMIATFVVVGISMSVLVWPNSADMLTVKQVLCGGQQDFVLFTNPAGYVVSRFTNHFEDAMTVQTFEQRAVEELRDMRAIVIGDTKKFLLPKLSVLQPNEQHYLQEKVATVRSFADTSAICYDLDTFKDGISLNSTPALFTVVRHMSGVNAALSLAEKAWTCREHKDYCERIPLLRTLCPVTCGCADPLSGLIYQGVASGCPSDCGPLLAERISNVSCTDLDVAGTESWKRYWRGLDIVFSDFLVEQDFESTLAEVGCSDSLKKLARKNLTVDLCSTSEPFLEEYGLGTILGFCPSTCCSGPTPAANCPSDCEAALP